MKKQIQKSLAFILAFSIVTSMFTGLVGTAGAVEMAELSGASVLYVSERGDDDSAGTLEAPFASLSKAFANVTGNTTIYVMSDLTLSAGVVYSGNFDVTVTSCDTEGATAVPTAGDYSNAHTVVRGDGYNNSMFVFDGGSGSVTFENIIIDGGNKAFEHGGLNTKGMRNLEGFLIYTNAAEFILNLGMNSVFQNNINTGKKGTACGGAICIDSIKKMNMTDNAVIRGNVAPRHGGAITMYSGTINMGGNALIYGNSIEFSGTYADTYFGGGAILLYADNGNCVLNLTDSASITNNYINLNKGSDSGRPHCSVMAPNTSTTGNSEIINLSGNARIYGNRDISNGGGFDRDSFTLSGGVENNLYAAPGKLFITGALQEYAKAGITLKNGAVGALVASGSDYTISDADVAQLFYDAGGFYIAKSENTAVLAAGVKGFTLGSIFHDKAENQLTVPLVGADAPTALNSSEVKVLKNGVAQDPSTYTVDVAGGSLTVSLDSIYIAAGDAITLEISKNGYQAVSHAITVPGDEPGPTGNKITWDGAIKSITSAGGKLSYQLNDAVITKEVDATAVTITVDNGSFTVGTLPGSGATYASRTDNGDVSDKLTTGTAYMTATIMLNPPSSQELQAVLDSVIFTKDVASKQTISLTAETMNLKLESRNVVPFGGHYYEFIPNVITWTEAYALAKQRTLYGLTGYLATITSKEEHDYIFKVFNNKPGWIGGTRSVTDLAAAKADGPTYTTVQYGTKYKNWYWVTGPEAGMIFYNSVKASGNTISGPYRNWSSGEPNNGSGEEAFLQYGWEKYGQWNDLKVDNKKGDSNQGYYVEYGGYPVESTKGGTLDVAVLPSTVSRTISASSWSGSFAGRLTEGDKASITVTGATSGMKYNVLDKDGKVVCERWETPVDGSLVLENLKRGETYTVVAVNSAVNTSAGVYQVGGTPGTAALRTDRGTVITPIVNPLNQGGIKQEKTVDETVKITIDTPAAESDTLIYGLYNTATHTFLGWESPLHTPGADVVFDNLSADVKYQIITAPRPTEGQTPLYAIGESGKPDARAVVSVPEGVKNRNHVLGSIDDNGKATITINPADPTLQYALLDKDGTEVKGWTAVNDGQVVFEGLTPNTTYKIVVREKTEASIPSAEDLAHIGLDITVIPKAPVPTENIRVTSSEIRLYQTESTLTYAVIDAETGAIVTTAGGTDGWQPGNGGIMVFTPLASGKTYEVVTLPNPLPRGVAVDTVLFHPRTAVVTNFNSMTGSAEAGEKSGITIKPADTERKYAVVDENGKVVGDWQNGSAQGIKFDGLTPGEGYKIISVPKNAAPDTEALAALPGVPFVAPALPKAQPEVTVTGTTITVSPADPKLEYALIGADGRIVDNTWRSAEKEGDSISFSGLDAGVPYQVAVRPKSGGESGGESGGTERPYITTGTQVFTPFTSIQGSTTESSAQITLSPAAATGYYAAVDADGNVIGGWKQAADGTVTWDNLAPGTNYKIIYVNDGTGRAPAETSGYQNTPGYRLITTPAPVNANNITSTGSSVTIASSETGYEYALIDKATGLPVPGGWMAGNGGSLVFPSLLPGKEYEVVRRGADGGADVPLPSAGTSVTTTGSAGTKYTVTYGEVSAQYVPGEQFLVPGAPAGLAGKIFTGWSDGQKIYQPGSIYAMPAYPVTFTAQWVETISISGTVQPAGATVSLWQGSKMTAEVTTGVDGSFQFDNLAPGVYNIRAEKDGDVVTETIKDAAPVTLSLGNGSWRKNSRVQVGSNTPDVVVGGLHEQFAAADSEFLKDDKAQTAQMRGGMVELVFRAQEQKEAAVQSDSNLIAALLPTGYQIGLYLDFHVERLVQEYENAEVTATRLTELSSLLEIYLPLPAALQGKTNYMVSRIHEGTAELLTPSTGSTEGFAENKVDGKTVSLTIYARKFSTYTVASAEATSYNTGSAAVKPAELHPEIKRLFLTQEHSTYMKGDEKGRFRPDIGMTRAEVAQMFLNLLKTKTVDAPAAFLDVKETAWYAQSASVLGGMGVMTGNGGRFRPEDGITRAEFAAIIARLAKLTPPSVTKEYQDLSKSHWAYDEIQAASKLGWLQGISSKEAIFAPDAAITRAEVVTIMNRILLRSPDKSHIDIADGVKLFPDVPKSHWAYYNIAEATNPHGYSRTSDGMSERWN